MTEREHRECLHAQGARAINDLVIFCLAVLVIVVILVSIAMKM